MQNTRLGNTFIKKKKEKKRGKLRVSFADFDPKISLVITFYTHDQTFQAQVLHGPPGQPCRTNELSAQLHCS